MSIFIQPKKKNKNMGKKKNDNFINKSKEENNFNKNDFYSEEENIDSDSDRKQINTRSFGDEQNQETYTNTNVNFKETDFKTSLLSERERIKDIYKTIENQKKNHNNNSNEEDNKLYKSYQFKISVSQNDFKNEKLLKLININSVKENVNQNLENFVNDPSYQPIEDNISNFNTNLKVSKYTTNSYKSNLNKQDLTHLISGMNLNIQVKEYYEKDFLEILQVKKITYAALEKSFMSHYSEYQNNFTSLFSNNVKEEFFKKQENLVIRTNDKIFNLEFLNDSNDNLNEDDLERGNLHEYTKYLKKRESTFLPYIIGVYKIKINNLREIKVVISKNNLIDEIPKEYFNYWQLIRIKEKDSFEMITSSKDRQSLLVSDELLVKNETKFNMINFNDFGKILYKDLQFLRRIKSAKYSLLIMYYEMGKNLANNSQSSLLEDDIKQFKDKYGRISAGSNNGMNYTNNNISAIRPIAELSAIDLSIKNEQIVNGFQSNVNEFRCILFFMFDNIFKKKKFYDFSKFCHNKHENFELMVRNKFQEIKD